MSSTVEVRVEPHLALASFDSAADARLREILRAAVGHPAPCCLCLRRPTSGDHGFGGRRLRLLLADERCGVAALADLRARLTQAS